MSLPHLLIAILSLSSCGGTVIADSSNAPEVDSGIAPGKTDSGGVPKVDAESPFEASSPKPPTCSGSASFVCYDTCSNRAHGSPNCVGGKWACAFPTPMRSDQCDGPPPGLPIMCPASPPTDLAFHCCTADGVDVPPYCQQMDAYFFVCQSGKSTPKGTPCAQSVVDAGRDAATDAGSVDGQKPTVSQCGDSRFIDDMEDGDNLICNVDGRSGKWSWIGQATTKIPVSTDFPSDILGGRAGSSRALHFGADGLQSDVGIATELVASGTFNASRYQGIELWTMVNPPPGGTADKITVALDDDQSCVGTCTGAYRVELSSGTGWQYHLLLFSAFTAGGKPPLDATHLKSLQLLLYPGPFEAWVDDVAFVVR
jgi:hypothetical protein